MASATTLPQLNLQQRTDEFHDAASSSDEDWADAEEGSGAESIEQARSQSLPSEPFTRPCTSKQPPVEPEHGRSRSALQEWELKEAELAHESSRRQAPLTEDAAAARERTPGVPPRAQLLHQRSDSAFSSAQSSEPAAAPAAEPSSSAVPAGPTSSLADDYPAHRAAFEGEGDLAVGLLMGLTAEQKCRLDPQGNTVLHVAVLRKHCSMVERLLALGLRSTVRNAKGWTPLEEAIAIRDRGLVQILHVAEVTAVKADMKSKRGLLLQQMKDMPDYSFKLKWELGSPVFGRLLRQFAPHDTYEVWKRGTVLRVDGSLMGIDDKSTSLIPEWKRGHFSLLFDGAPKPATIYFVDHRKKRYFDLTAERKKQTAAADAEVSEMLAEGANKTKMKASEFRFKPVKGWLGGEQTETIEGWKTKVYEATGKMNAVTTIKGKLLIPPGATFEEYLALAAEEDTVKESPVDLLSLNPGGKASPEAPVEGPSAAAKGKKTAKQPRKLSGKCWMAADFPMSLRQLIPILDIVGYTNKHLARVGKFMHKYGDMDLFPVKLQVPLLWTAYAQVSFRDFTSLDLNSQAGQDRFFQLPQDYTPRTLDDVVLARGKRVAERDSLQLQGSTSHPNDPFKELAEQDGIKFEL